MTPIKSGVRLSLSAFRRANVERKFRTSLEASEAGAELDEEMETVILALDDEDLTPVESVREIGGTRKGER